MNWWRFDQNPCIQKPKQRSHRRTPIPTDRPIRKRIRMETSKTDCGDGRILERCAGIVGYESKGWSGWDNGLCQDYCGPLYRWFESRVDVKARLKELNESNSIH
jgi:hypothetical protein